MLSEKHALLIATNFFGYEKDIATDLRKLIGDIDFVSESLYFSTPFKI
tara:strand:- start:6881 stop:7024 length:144 start_codon:yes stop_codon:yes gene_type:complete